MGPIEVTPISITCSKTTLGAVTLTTTQPAPMRPVAMRLLSTTAPLSTTTSTPNVLPCCRPLTSDSGASAACNLRKSRNKWGDKPSSVTCKLLVWYSSSRP
eukprot:scaffold95367_cov31-Tisochrysis_lutea.AAC.1